MIVKKHLADGKLVLAICDSEIIGRKFSDEKHELDLGSDFYKGEEMDEKRIKNLIKCAYLVNLAGTKAVQLAVDLELVSNVMQVEGIPHAQVLIARNDSGILPKEA